MDFDGSGLLDVLQQPGAWRDWGHYKSPSMWAAMQCITMMEWPTVSPAAAWCSAVSGTSPKAEHVDWTRLATVQNDEAAVEDTNGYTSPDWPVMHQVNRPSWQLTNSAHNWDMKMTTK